MAGPTTVISAGIRLTGDLAGDGDVLILGRVDGQIHVGGELIIGPGGFAKADVVAGRVRIDGRLEGRVRATRQVVIGAHGALIGDVQGLLAVEEGGLFKGRVDVEIDTSLADTVDPLRSLVPRPAGAGEPDLGSQLTPRRLVKVADRPDPPAPPKGLPEVRRMSDEDVITGPIARPLLSLPIKQRTPTAPAAQRSTGEVADDRRSARRPKRLVTRRDTAHEADPTNEMDRVSVKVPTVPAPLDPRTADIPVVRAGGDRSGSARARARAAAPARVATPPRPLLPIVHPPHVHRPAIPTARKRPMKGDPVQERADLTDEWFLDEDEDLRRG